MSDYLDNLVARSLGLAEVVQPRPLSIFEPLQPTGLPAPDPNSLEEVGEPSSNLEPLRVTSSAPDVKLSEAPPANLRETQSGPPSQNPVQVTRRGESQSTSLLIPHQPLMPAPVAGDADMRADRSEYAAPAGQQTVDSQPAVSEHAPLRVVFHAATPADRQSTATQEATPLIPAHGTAPSSRTLLVAPEITLRPNDRQERGDPWSDGPEPIPAAQRETAPTIKITIGRVDVRAVMPERPAPRPAPVARNPALSLEEYLKERSGGKS
jgi:hypothetical protein